MEIFSVFIKLYCVFFLALYLDLFLFAVFLFNNLLNFSKLHPISISDSSISRQIKML